MNFATQTWGFSKFSYDGENDSQNITKLRQEIGVQMEKLDDRELDLIMGKYNRPPGVKDYEPPKVPMPKPTPPTGLRKISPVFTDTSSVFSTHATVSTASPDIAAGYQIFGRWAEWMTDKSYIGSVWSRTESVQYLKNDLKEWHVMHQYEADAQSNIIAENAILLLRQDDRAICAPFLSSLGGHQISDYVNYPASHIISIGICPRDVSGREYNKVFMWIWDRTDDVFWSKTYNLPQTEKITIVDAALETYAYETPNSQWKYFYEFSPTLPDGQDIANEFSWSEWSTPFFNNEHSEEYYYNYVCLECSCGDPYGCEMYPEYCYWYEVPCEGPRNSGTMWQRKTPK